MSLSEEQIKSIEVCWRKWEALVALAEPVNQEQMTKAIKQLYKLGKLDEPEILYVASPSKYYAQAFLLTMPEWVQEAMERSLRSNPNNIFLAKHQKNVARALINRLSIQPTDNASGRYTRLLLQKVRSGIKRHKASLEADEETYSPQDRAMQKLEGEIERKLGEISNFSDYDFGFYAGFSEENPCGLWMLHLLNSLNSKLEIPGELLLEAIDMGYKMDDYAGRCLHRVGLAFLGAKLECFKNVLNFEETFIYELIRSLMQFGGSMLFPYERICIVCDSPRIILLNDDASSDAKTNTYVKFSDGFTIF